MSSSWNVTRNGVIYSFEQNSDIWCAGMDGPYMTSISVMSKEEGNNTWHRYADMHVRLNASDAAVESQFFNWLE